MVAAWDLAAHNIFANQAYLDKLALTQDEMRDVHMREVLGPMLWSLNSGHVDAVLAGTPQQFARSIVDASGQERTYQSVYTPTIVDGHQTGFLTVITDISGRPTTPQAQLAEIGLLEQRQEAAVEMHDTLIQRLFAVGLQVSAARRSHGDDQTLLASAMEGIDGAISDLRDSIPRGRQPRSLGRALQHAS